MVWNESSQAALSAQVDQPACESTSGKPNPCKCRVDRLISSEFWLYPSSILYPLPSLQFFYSFRLMYNFHFYSPRWSLWSSGSTKIDRSLFPNQTVVFQVLLLFVQWDWVHNWKWLKTCHNLFVDKKEARGCNWDYFQFLWPWLS